MPRSGKAVRGRRDRFYAWIASGSDAFALSIAACDLFVGRPSWDELLLAALHKVAVAALPVEGRRALLDALRTASAPRASFIDDVASVLALAAALDRRLSDPDSLDARGIALREAVFAADAELIDALAGLEPLPQAAAAAAAAAAAWEAVGPHAADLPRDGGTVEARDPAAPRVEGSSRAQKIEDALEALKQKMQGPA